MIYRKAASPLQRRRPVAGVRFVCLPPVLRAGGGGDEIDSTLQFLLLNVPGQTKSTFLNMSTHSLPFLLI